MFATNLYLSIYLKAFFETFKKGVALVVIAGMLHIILPGALVTRMMIVPLIALALVLIGQLTNHIIGIVKISTNERYVSNERASSKIISQVTRLVNAIHRKSPYVEQQAKVLLGLIYIGLNGGLKLKTINFMLAKFSREIELGVKNEIENDSESATWIKPKSATLILYKSKEPIARLTMFEM